MSGNLTTERCLCSVLIPANYVCIGDSPPSHESPQCSKLEPKPVLILKPEGKGASISSLVNYVHVPADLR